MTIEKNVEPYRMTRRAALRGGMAAGFACLLPREILAGIAMPGGPTSGLIGPGLNPNSASLYAFARRNGETTVIALSWPQQSRGSAIPSNRMTEARVYTDSQAPSISIPLGKPMPLEWETNGYRVFTGSVAALAGTQERYLESIVLETPRHLISEQGTLNIWAELRSENGTRQRIGSPFLSELLASNEGLAKLYHASSPEDDLRGLATAVGEAVSERARAAANVSNPEQYGRRLALALLPDFLRFDPALPSGFTFASQNGRHPSDSTGAVVKSILSGSPSIGAGSVTAKMKSEFPYFCQRLYAI